jgi:hypothetical protein
MKRGLHGNQEPINPASEHGHLLGAPDHQDASCRANGWQEHVSIEMGAKQFGGDAWVTMTPINRKVVSFRVSGMPPPSWKG